ncbi:hypothetical protein [Winogradskyella tangerina]|uniref:hypothetical protein n=1 Tax=Winogradskyella tangerina TaxID=2023240 RepID=UPI000DBE996E|nr:hypothetical protein [Winogradskyella tangerina]
MQLFFKSIKSLFFLITLGLLIFSCENESIQGEQQQEDPTDPFEPPPVQLILNELKTTELNDFQREFINYFDPTGRHTSSDANFTQQNTIFTSIEEIAYNSNGLRTSYNKNNNGFETNAVNFAYQDNVLTQVTDVVSGPGNTYTLDYSNNQIIVNVSGNFEGRFVYVFADNTFQQLISSESTIPYVNASSNPNYRFEYQYDSELNISQITRLEYNDTTEMLEVDYTEVYTYDDKFNPLRVLFETNPLIVLDPDVVRPLVYGISSHSRFYNNRNILTITRNYSNSTEQRLTTFTYTYNEFDFPTSSSEINTTIDTSTNEETEGLMRDREYTYYD